AALLDRWPAAGTVGPAGGLPLRRAVSVRGGPLPARVPAGGPGVGGPQCCLLAGEMSDTPVLRVQGLTKHFPVTQGLFWTSALAQVKAVDGISFAVPQGETLAIVGESGCGKTTTAKLILRLEEPT